MGVADSKRNFVYGLHAVNAVLERAPERLLELWIAKPRDDARTRELRDRAQHAGVRVQSVGGETLAKLVGDVAHQGAVAAVRALKAWDEHDLIEALSRAVEDPLLLVLDGVTDPHNLGACLRTADAAGVHAVLIPKDRAATVDGVVTTTAPVTATVWISVSCTSPVPGGRSMMRWSSSPHCALRRNCVMTLCSMGPRQTSGLSPGFKKPMDMSLTPKFSSGWMRSPYAMGVLLIPIMSGTLGP